VSTPHDALFKATFSELEHARSELSLVLPRALAECVDWASLALASGSFNDDTLEYLDCDLLFSARIAGRDACIYLLFEHQSTVDHLMPLRLLRYMTRIWDRFSKNNHGAPLPVIVPVVLHHSSTGWTGATHFSELLDLGGDLRIHARPYVPDFGFVLDDLSKVNDQALRARAVTEFVQLTQLMLQRCRGAVDPVAILSPWFDTFVALVTAPNGSYAIQALASYTLQATEGHAEELRAFFQKVGPIAEEAFVTAAEKLTEQVRAKALEQGRMVGRAEGEAAILLRLLTRRFGPLTPEVQARLVGATTDELELWADRVLNAPTLDDVFGA
jgi:predicted transposase/invertase (TIGR01784 family)